VGIADQKPDMFGDSRFRDAGVPIARVQVGWDVMTSDWQREELDRWLVAARAAGVRPLVSFGPSRTQRRTLPSPSRFKYEFRRVRAAWPWVREYTTWNEANHCGAVTCHRAALVAAYWRQLRRTCAGHCVVLAAEVLDMPNMLAWTREFLRRADIQPALWGMHNYVDGNRFKTASTRALLRAVRGRVWLTETGGLVSRRKRAHQVDLKESKWHALRVNRFLLRDIMALSPRLERLYLYHWNAGAELDPTWDSALFAADGTPRPSWGVVRDALHGHAPLAR
jgi:hypothetical protein